MGPVYGLISIDGGDSTVAVSEDVCESVSDGLFLRLCFRLEEYPLQDRSGNSS